MLFTSKPAAAVVTAEPKTGRWRRAGRVVLLALFVLVMVLTLGYMVYGLLYGLFWG